MYWLVKKTLHETLVIYKHIYQVIIIGLIWIIYALLIKQKIIKQKVL